MHTCIHAYMHTCIHACMHACIHTYIHTYTHTHIHTDTQTHRHTDTQTHRHTDTQTDIQTYRHTDIQTYRHTDIQTYRHTDIHTYIHTCMHACIHTYTYIYMLYIRQMPGLCPEPQLNVKFNGGGFLIFPNTFVDLASNNIWLGMGTLYAGMLGQSPGVARIYRYTHDPICIMKIVKQSGGPHKPKVQWSKCCVAWGNVSRCRK